MASQLNLDDLRNARQALAMYNSLNISPAIKHICPDPGLGHLLPERISRIEVVEGRPAFCRQTLVQRDRWLQLVDNSSDLGSKISLAPLGKNATEHQQLYSLCLVGNQFENSIERALGSSKKSLKNCQNSNRSSSCSYLVDGGPVLR